GAPSLRGVAADGGPRVRISFAPALSHVRTRLPRSVGRLASTCGYHCPLGGSGHHNADAEPGSGWRKIGHAVEFGGRDRRGPRRGAGAAARPPAVAPGTPHP